MEIKQQRLRNCLVKQLLSVGVIASFCQQCSYGVQHGYNVTNTVNNEGPLLFPLKRILNKPYVRGLNKFNISESELKNQSENTQQPINVYRSLHNYVKPNDFSNTTLDNWKQYSTDNNEDVQQLVPPRKKRCIRDANNLGLAPRQQPLAASLMDSNFDSCCEIINRLIAEAFRIKNNCKCSSNKSVDIKEIHPVLPGINESNNDELQQVLDDVTTSNYNKRSSIGLEGTKLLNKLLVDQNQKDITQPNAENNNYDPITESLKTDSHTESIYDNIKSIVQDANESSLEKPKLKSDITNNYSLQFERNVTEQSTLRVNSNNTEYIFTERNEQYYNRDNNNVFSSDTKNTHFSKRVKTDDKVEVTSTRNNLSPDSKINSELPGNTDLNDKLGNVEDTIGEKDKQTDTPLIIPTNSQIFNVTNYINPEKYDSPNNLGEIKGVITDIVHSENSENLQMPPTFENKTHLNDLDEDIEELKTLIEEMINETDSNNTTNDYQDFNSLNETDENKLYTTNNPLNMETSLIGLLNNMYHPTDTENKPNNYTILDVTTKSSLITTESYEQDYEDFNNNETDNQLAVETTEITTLPTELPKLGVGYLNKSVDTIISENQINMKPDLLTTQNDVDRNTPTELPILELEYVTDDDNHNNTVDVIITENQISLKPEDNSFTTSGYISIMPDNYENIVQVIINETNENNTEEDNNISVVNNKEDMRESNYSLKLPIDDLSNEDVTLEDESAMNVDNITDNTEYNLGGNNEYGIEDVHNISESNSQEQLNDTVSNIIGATYINVSDENSNITQNDKYIEAVTNYIQNISDLYPIEQAIYGNSTDSWEDVIGDSEIYEGETNTDDVDDLNITERIPKYNESIMNNTVGVSVLNESIKDVSDFYSANENETDLTQNISNDNIDNMKAGTSYINGDQMSEYDTENQERDEANKTGNFIETYLNENNTYPNKDLDNLTYIDNDNKLNRINELTTNIPFENTDYLGESSYSNTYETTVNPDSNLLGYSDGLINVKKYSNVNKTFENTDYMGESAYSNTYETTVNPDSNLLGYSDGLINVENYSNVNKTFEIENNMGKPSVNENNTMESSNLTVNEDSQSGTNDEDVGYNLNVTGKDVANSEEVMEDEKSIDVVQDKEMKPIASPELIPTLLISENSEENTVLGILLSPIWLKLSHPLLINSPDSKFYMENNGKIVPINIIKTNSLSSAYNKNPFQLANKITEDNNEKININDNSNLNSELNNIAKRVNGNSTYDTINDPKNLVPTLQTTSQLVNSKNRINNNKRNIHKNNIKNRGTDLYTPSKLSFISNNTDFRKELYTNDISLKNNYPERTYQHISKNKNNDSFRFTSTKNKLHLLSQDNLHVYHELDKDMNNNYLDNITNEKKVKSINSKYDNQQSKRSLIYDDSPYRINLNTEVDQSGRFTDDQNLLDVLYTTVKRIKKLFKE